MYGAGSAPAAACQPSARCGMHRRTAGCRAPDHPGPRRRQWCRTWCSWFCPSADAAPAPAGHLPEDPQPERAPRRPWSAPADQRRGYAASPAADPGCSGSPARSGSCTQRSAPSQPVRRSLAHRSQDPYPLPHPWRSFPRHPATAASEPLAPASAQGAGHWRALRSRPCRCTFRTASTWQGRAPAGCGCARRCALWACRACRSSRSGLYLPSFSAHPPAAAAPCPARPVGQAGRSTVHGSCCTPTAAAS